MEMELKTVGSLGYLWRKGKISKIFAVHVLHYLTHKVIETNEYDSLESFRALLTVPNDTRIGPEATFGCEATFRIRHPEKSEIEEIERKLLPEEKSITANSKACLCIEWSFGLANIKSYAFILAPDSPAR